MKASRPIMQPLKKRLVTASEQTEFTESKEDFVSEGPAEAFRPAAALAFTLPESLVTVVLQFSMYFQEAETLVRCDPNGVISKIIRRSVETARATKTEARMDDENAPKSVDLDVDLGTRVQVRDVAEGGRPETFAIFNPPTPQNLRWMSGIVTEVGSDGKVEVNVGFRPGADRTRSGAVLDGAQSRCWDQIRKKQANSLYIAGQAVEGRYHEGTANQWYGCTILTVPHNIHEEYVRYAIRWGDGPSAGTETTLRPRDLRAPQIEVICKGSADFGWKALPVHLWQRQVADATHKLIAYIMAVPSKDIMRNFQSHYDVPQMDRECQELLFQGAEPLKIGTCAMKRLEGIDLRGLKSMLKAIQRRDRAQEQRMAVKRRLKAEKERKEAMARQRRSLAHKKRMELLARHSSWNIAASV